MRNLSLIIATVCIVIITVCIVHREFCDAYKWPSEIKVK